MSLRDRLPDRLSRPAVWGVVGVAVFVTVAALLVARAGTRVVAPPPGGAGEAPTLAQIPPSSLNIPVEYDLGRVVDLLEEVVPTELGDLSQAQFHPAGEGVRYAYEVRRGPLHLELRGDTAHLSAVLHYQGRATYRVPVLGEVSAACAEEGGIRPRAVLEISSPLQVTPEWTLRSDTRIERLEPYGTAARDRCRLPGLGLDLTDLVVAAVARGLDGLPARVDSLVAGFDLRTPVERQWALLAEPFPLAPEVWVVLHPVEVRRARIEGAGPAGATLRGDLALTARPRVVVGDRPATTASPLPPLERAPPEEGLHLLVEGRAGYGALSDLVARELEGRSFHAVGRPVDVRDVELQDAGGGRLAMRVDVEGTFRGTIFLVGTPVYDAASDEIRVPDLDFHVESRNLLVRAAAWILRAGFPEHVRRHARWPVEETLRHARSLAGGRLDHPLPGGARLVGELGSVELTEVAATADGLVVRVVLAGSAGLVVAGR